MIKKNFKIIFIITFIEFIVYLSEDMYIPGRSIIANDLNTTDKMIDYTFSIFFIGCIIPLIFIRQLLMIFNIKKTILIGTGMFFIISTFLYYVDNINTMIFMRLLHGISVIIIFNANSNFIFFNYDRITATKINSLISFILMISPLCGPFIGKFIIYCFGWRYIFFIISILSLISFLLILVFFKDKKNVVIEKFNISDFKTVLKSTEFWKLCMARTLLTNCIIMWIFHFPNILSDLPVYFFTRNNYIVFFNGIYFIFLYS